MIAYDVQLPDQPDPIPEALAAEALNAAAAAVRAEVRGFFQDLDTRPGRFSEKRHFMLEVADAVGQNTGPDGAVDITVADPRYWRRLLGGDPIVPKTGSKYLAIPATGPAYLAGRPAAGRGLPELAPLYRRIRGERRAVALADDVKTSKSGRKYSAAGNKNSTGQVWYWLVLSANPPADPTLAPDESALTATATAAASAFITASLPPTASPS